MASAFVLVRADTRGFRSSVESEVRGSLRSVSQIAAGVTGGVIAVEIFRDIGRGLRGIAAAASEEQVRAELLSKTIDNVGASHRAFGQDIEDLIDKESRLQGFTDQQLSSALARLVQATGNTGKAFRDLGLAEDIARVRKIELGQAAIALAKAEQGSTTALARLGIIVPKVHDDVAKLTAQHDRLTAAGVKLTAQQELEFKQAVALAAARDAQASKTSALAAVETRFGGSAATFAGTAAGALDRAQVSLNEFIESLGKELLPPLTRAALETADFLRGVQQSGDVQAGAAAGAHLLGEAVHGVEEAAQTAGPPLVALAQAANTVVSTIGAPALLAGIAAYKGLGLAAAGAGAAQTLYNRALLIGAAETTVETAAIRRLTAAQVEQAAASLAGSSRTALLGRGIAGLVSPAAVATVGVAALAGGIVYLATQETQLESANRRLIGSLRELDSALQGTQTAARTLADAQAEIPTDKIAISSAQLAVAQAKANLEQSAAAKGSLEYAQQQNALAVAQDSLRQANLRLATDQRAVEDAQRGAVAQSEKLQASYNAERGALEKLVTAAETRVDPTGRRQLIQQPFGTDQATRATAALQQAREAAKEFGDELERDAAKAKLQDPALARNVQSLADFSRAIDHIPTRAEIELFLDNRDANKTLAQFLADVAALGPAGARDAKTAGGQIGQGFVQGIRDGVFTNPLFGPNALDLAVAAAADGAKPAADTAGREVALALIAGISAELQTAEAGLSSASSALSDALAKQVAQINESIAAAKSNLGSIATSIGSAAADVIDARTKNTIDAIDAALERGQGSLLVIRGQVEGLIAKGNINLLNRPAVKNPDGSVSSVRSASFGLEGGREVLLPTVIKKDGRWQVVSDEEALAHFKKTGENLGTFASAAFATAYAEKLHLEQAGLDALKQGGIDAAVHLALEIHSLQSQLDKISIRKQRSQLEFAIGQATDTATRTNAVASLAEFELQTKLDTDKKKLDSDKTAIQKAAEAQKTAVKENLAAYADSFAKGQITLAQFSGRVLNTLHGQIPNFGEVGGLLGKAFRSAFDAEIQGLLDQAEAIGAAPKRPGGTTQVQVTKPADVIAETAKNIATLQKARDDAALEVAKDQKALLRAIRDNTAKPGNPLPKGPPGSLTDPAIVGRKGAKVPAG